MHDRNANARRLFVGVDESHDFVGAAVGAEDVFDLVLDELLDVRAAICDVLARIEVLRMRHEVLADASRHCKTEVGVDVDLADRGLRCLAELILRNADSVIELAAVVVDDLDIFRDDGGSAVEDNRELRNLLLDLSEDVEAELRRYENAVSIARALLRFELECAMARADCDSEGVNARLTNEFLNLFRLRVSCLVSSNLYIILDTSKFAELSLNANAMLMSVSNNFLRTFDVLFEVIVRTIEHDRRETVIDASFASLEVCAVVEVQSNRDIVDLQSSLNEVTEIRALCIFTSASGSLKDNRGIQLSSCFRDTLNDFHVVDVESTDSVTALISFLEHFFSTD